MDQERLRQAISSSLAFLPNELILQIFTHLDASSLSRISQTSQLFHDLAETESLWAALSSSLRLSSPAPYPTFKALRTALHPFLYLHGHIWHCDRRFTGSLLLCLYSPVTGTLDLKPLLFIPTPAPVSTYSLNTGIIATSFHPKVSVFDDSILSLGPSDIPDENGEYKQLQTRAIYYSLAPCTSLPPESQSASMSLWPPTTIPAEERTRNVSQQGFVGRSWRPARGEAAKSLFRIRKWLQYPSSSHTFAFSSPGRDAPVETYSALNTAAITPDSEHPYRGVWVGDYASHGVEVLAFLQDSPTTLEAIKITGDVNVPRGERSWRIDDLETTTRIAEESEWAGARCVQAWGQIAERCFVNAQDIEGEVILLGEDEVAFVWDFARALGEDVLGKISRFRRVNVDELLYWRGEGDAVVLGDGGVTAPTTEDDVS